MTSAQGISVRAEGSADAGAVREVNLAAFGREEEADIVDALRTRRAVTLSLVAVADGRAVGHILFSPVTIESPVRNVAAVGLGPMAVLPATQRQGIGSRLVQEGLRRLRSAGHDAVVVLGHPSYYPRFGFVPASHYGLRWEFDCPDEAFMALELRPGALAGVDGGIVRYRPEFGGD